MGRGPPDGRGNPLDVTAIRGARRRPTGRRSDLVGEEYAAISAGRGAGALRRRRPAAWILAGTGLSRGSTVPDVLLSISTSSTPVPTGQPADLAHSPVRWATPRAASAPNAAFVYSDMTYYTDPSSHGLDTGTNNWIHRLEPCPPHRRPVWPLSWPDHRQPAAPVRSGSGRAAATVDPNWQQSTRNGEPASAMGPTRLTW